MIYLKKLSRRQKSNLPESSPVVIYLLTFLEMAEPVLAHTGPKTSVDEFLI